MTALPGPRPYEARFLAAHLVPFVVRATDLLAARGAGSPQAGDPGAQALHEEAVRVDSSIARIIRAVTHQRRRDDNGGPRADGEGVPIAWR
jgi:hypothetical protein